MKRLLMLPTYNEKDNLENLIRELINIESEIDILIIDDSSQDGTGEIADRLSQEFPQVIVMHRPPKSGRGTASKDGYNYAIENGYDHYLEMDVDHSHQPKELPSILEASKEADLVIGSRFVPGGGVDGWGFKRRLMHFGADVAVKILLGTPNTDHTNGYRCYSVDMLKKIDLDKLDFTGYASHTLLENILYKAGFKIKEVPSFFINREKGASKNSWREAVKGIIALIKHRWAYICHGYKYFLK